MKKLYIFFLLLLCALINGCKNDQQSNVLHITDKRINGVIEALSDAVLKNRYRDTDLHVDTLVKIGSQATPHIQSWLNSKAKAETKKNLIAALSKMGVGALSVLPTLEEYKNLNKDGLGRDAEKAISEINRFKTCGFPELPEHVKIFYLYVNKGTESLDDYQFKDSVDEVRKVEVIVTEKEKPVVLFLFGNNSLLWKVGTLPGVNLAGAYVDGAKSQALTGISKNVPHRIIQSNRVGNKCPSINLYENHLRRYSYYEKDTYDDTKLNLVSLTGRRIDEHIPTKHKDRYFAGPVHNGIGAAVFSDDIPLEHFLKKRNVPYGEKGFNLLFNKGVLRNIHKSDLENWKTILDSKPKEEQQIYFATTYLRSYNKIFVVTKNTYLPDGINDGSGSPLSFILPPGVAVLDRSSHRVSIIDLND